MKKILLIIPLLSISLLFSQQREEIVFRHINGVKNIIFVYEGSGSKEKLVKKLEYFDNEQIKTSMEWKKGIVNGKWTEWYKNGQKQGKGTYKDGKRDGKFTWWYENGQKASEVTWKDGEKIFSKCWDEDGNECECNFYDNCKSLNPDAITNDQLVNNYVEAVSQTVAMAVEAPLKLKIVTSERIWYSITADTYAPQAGILPAGDEKSLSFENQIYVRLNQTAGTTLYINGIKVDALGEFNYPAEIQFFAESSTITVKHYIPQR